MGQKPMPGMSKMNPASIWRFKLTPRQFCHRPGMLLLAGFILVTPRIAAARPRAVWVPARWVRERRGWYSRRRPLAVNGI